MKRIRFNNLGIEVEISTGMVDFFEIKEKKNCVKVSHNGQRIATVLQDSKIVISDIVHIICYKGRVAVFGNAYVEAGRLSKVFAKDRAQVVAFQGSEVRASGRVKVRALDSRVVATGRAQVDLEGKSIGYKKSHSRARISKLDNRAKVVNID